MEQKAYYAESKAVSTAYEGGIVPEKAGGMPNFTSQPKDIGKLEQNRNQALEYSPERTEP